MNDGSVDVHLGVVGKWEGERRQKNNLFFSSVNRTNGTLRTFVLVPSSPFHPCFVDLAKREVRSPGPFPAFWDNWQQC